MTFRPEKSRSVIPGTTTGEGKREPAPWSGHEPVLFRLVPYFEFAFMALSAAKS